MDALLILAGLLLMLAGLVWLVMLAFGTSLLWGWGSLLPPITLIYVFKHWRKARKAVFIFALGIIPLVVGLAQLASKDASRLDALLSLRWLKPAEQTPLDLDIRLRGELNGQPFAPQQAELINGVLSLREGQDFFARREVNIRLPKTLKAPLRVDVLPEDEGALPEVEVTWLLPEQDLPEARRLNKGYTLHLDLQPLPPNKLVGDFHLVLPPQYETTLSGRLELFSDHLRYREGLVDTAFDSQDTLAYVINDYLQRRFATRKVEISDFPIVAFPTRRVTTTIGAKIGEQQAQQIPLVLEKTASGWRVEGDRYEAVPEIAPAQTKVAPAAPAESKPAIKAERPTKFTLLNLLSTPKRYIGLNMRVVRTSGGNAEGQFEGLDEDGNIRLRQQRGGAGLAVFTLKPDDVSRIEPIEP